MKKIFITTLAVISAITLINFDTSAQQGPPRERDGERPNFGQRGQGGERGSRGERPNFGGRGQGQGEERGQRGQRQNFGGRGQRPGGAEFMRMFPIIAALDADSDGIISEKEISNATAALKKLDTNKDGKLVAEEIMPRPPQFGGPRGPRGPESQNGGQRLGGSGSPDNNTDTLVDRIMRNDKNGDGKLSRDEVSGRLSSIFNRADKNKDGVATKDELKAALGAPGETRGRRNP